MPPRTHCAHATPVLLAALLLLGAGLPHTAALGKVPRRGLADVAAPDAAPAPAPARTPYALSYSDNREGKPLLTPSVTELEGRTIYYEVPEDPVGLLVLFHGCYHSAYDFWPEQPDCPECRGLPEEVSHTKQALSAGYAVAAMNSLNRQEEGDDVMCFSWEDDRESGIAALRAMPSELGLEDLPIYVGGVSSGAAFALRLPSEMPGELSGVVSEVLAVPTPAQQPYDWSSWPPVAFVSMPKDTSTQQRIAENVQLLNGAGVPAQIIQVFERLVYPRFFSDQTPEIPAQLSEKIVAALKQLGVLDERGELTDDPRLGFKDMAWRIELTKLVPELDGSDPSNSVVADASDVSELLNVAYAEHEIQGDYTFAILKWLEQGGGVDLNQLAAEYVIRKPALLSPERLEDGEAPATAGGPPLP